jgi:insertion element IS1 protein InsB
MNALGKIFGVRASSVLQWIRRYATAHYRKPAPSGKVVVMELDEMWHFLQKNGGKLWIWKARDRDTGHLLDWECGRRDAATLKKLINRLAQWDVTFYCTDHWKTYASVIPTEKLVMSKVKTGGIERNRCQQRHRFGRSKCRSIIVSKSQEMVDPTMALFARYRVNGSVSEIFTLTMVT